MPMPDLNQTHGSGGTEEQGPHQMKNLVCFVSRRVIGQESLNLLKVLLAEDDG